MAINTSPGTGARSAIAIGEQVTFETPVRPTHALDFTSEGVSGSETVINSEAITGDRGRKFVGRGNIDVGGDISTELAPDGFGMILRHGLGDYITSQYVDGGLHARIDGAAQTLGVGGGHSFENTAIHPLSDDTIVAFEDAGAVTHIKRDANDALEQEANIAYTKMNVWDLAAITAINNNDVDVSDGAAAYSITFGPNNQGETPSVNFDAGILEFRQGSVGTSVRYYDAQDLGGGSVKVFLDPSQIAAASALPTDPQVGNIVIVKPAITSKAAAFTFADAPVVGDWLLQYDATYAEVFTHTIMAGNQLPPAGLTVEEDRDNAIFLYSGCKVGTIAVSFEPDAFVTASFSLTGRREHVEARLQSDVVPDATEIFIDDADHYQFVDPTLLAAGKAYMTIDERTGISYTTKEVNYNNTGTTRLSGIPTSAHPTTPEENIDEILLKGAAVVALTSTGIEPLYEGVKTPIVMWMASLYMKGQWEEGLAGSLTVENNLDGEKFGFGGQYRFGLVEGRRDITTSITVEFDDGKHITRWKKGEYISMEFRCASQNDDALIGDTDVPAQMHFYLSRVRLTGETPNVEDTSFITHDLPGVGLDDAEKNTPGLVLFAVNGQQYDVAAP